MLIALHTICCRDCVSLVCVLTVCQSVECMLIMLSYVPEWFAIGSPYTVHTYSTEFSTNKPLLIASVGQLKVCVV